MQSMLMSTLLSSRCAARVHVLAKGLGSTVSHKVPPRFEAALYGEGISEAGWCSL